MTRWQICSALAAFAVVACSHERDRAAWLASTLAIDNQAELERAPERVAGKLAKMSRDPFSYLRGSSRQFLRDLTDHPTWSQPTSFSSAAASLVLLVGDPHPENIGGYRAAGDLRADWNDFDAAWYGPFEIDVRRLAVALAVLARTVAPDNPDLARDVAAAAAAAYADEIRIIDAGGEPFLARASDGEVIEDLLEHAAEDGAERIELLRYTAITNGRRGLVYGDIEPPTEDGYPVDRLERLPDDERAMVGELVAAYRATLVGPPPPEAFFAVKGMARELGVGIASYALDRFLVLVEGPTTAVADDRLLELKQAPPAPGEPIALPFPRWASDAERVVRAARALQEDAVADPLLGWAVSGRLSVRVREVSGYQRQLDVDRFVRQFDERDWSAGDLLIFAVDGGRLLARAHGLAATAAGVSGNSVIAPVLAADPDGFAGDTADFAEAYAGQVEEDHELLARLLEQRGPLLGWKTP